MAISESGRLSVSIDPSLEKVRNRAPRAALFGLFVDYWEIMLPVIALTPALIYFLPADLSHSTRATLTFLTFAAAFLGRPLGSVIFGHYADVIGRRRTTLVCSAGLAVSVFLMVLLPGYETAGLWGFGAVLALRLSGGIFMGGQYTGANPLAMESVAKERRGAAGGLIASAWPLAYVGVSVVTGLLLWVLPQDGISSAYVTWGWRIPFLIGAVLAVAAYFYFRSLEESPTWEAAKAAAAKAHKVPIMQTRSPLSELFRGENLRNLAQVFVLMTGIWLGLQMLTVAPAGLLIAYLGQSPQTVVWSLLAANVVLFPCYLIAGHLGQRFGRRRVLMVSGVLSATVSAAALATMLYLINNGYPLSVAFGLFTIALCLTVAPNAIMIPYICERFATGVRASGYGIGYTLAVVIPAFYSFMLVGLDNFIPYEYGTVVLLVAGGVCMVAGAALGPETKDVDLGAAQ